MAEVKRKINFQDSPVVWFTILEAARKKGDWKKAMKAQEELERLGVQICFGEGANRGN